MLTMILPTLVQTTALDRTFDSGLLTGPSGFKPALWLNDGVGDSPRVILVDAESKQLILQKLDAGADKGGLLTFTKEKDGRVSGCAL